MHQLSPQLIEMLDHFKQSKNYQKKQILYYEGSPMIGLYCLQSGKVKIYKTGAEGRQHILHISETGCILGIESLFSNHYTSTVEMLEDGTVSFLDKKAFFDLLRQEPDLLMKVIKLLASELEESETERVELAQSSVRERLARLLSLLSQSHGSPCPKGIRINLALSREELAEMTGTVAETAMRLLKEFREEKVLSVHGREIIITDQNRLKEVANLE